MTYMEASHQQIPPRERLILALDVATPEEAREWVERLGESVEFYKLGLELFMAGGYFELVEDLRRRGKKIFVDLKFFDIPQTVASAVRQLNGRGVTFATVHGNDGILKAAAEAKGDVQILGVTVLTSLDQGDMDDLGFQTDIPTLVRSRARRAIEHGCDGVVASGHEAAAIRRELDKAGLGGRIVVPGIRPGEGRRSDDQKRTVDVEKAFEKGADYIVVGRPIRGAEDPKAAAEAIQQRIARHFGAD
ncbi:MAG: orotidine-5'-phosphate decarboxylase [Acidobacteriota bacterium]|nr:orotidine-5'-phosphate decarboxylase [Acidobacteriota bacterium]